MKKKVDCCLSEDSFLAHALLQGDSAALPCYKCFAAGFQPVQSSPFMVMLLLRKVVRFRNFLRTWLPRRLSLVGADTSNETGRFQTQILMNQKKKFLVKDTWNLAFVEPPSCLPWSFSFLLSHVPFLWQQTTFPWSFSFLLSHVPFLWRQTTFLGLLLFFLTSPFFGGTDQPWRTQRL